MKKMSMALVSASVVVFSLSAKIALVDASIFDSLNQDEAQHEEKESSKQNPTLAYKCEPFPECIIWPDPEDYDEKKMSSPKNTQDSSNSSLNLR